MTETSCVISGMDEGDNLTGHVGSPNPACGKLLTDSAIRLILQVMSLYDLIRIAFFRSKTCGCPGNELYISG